MSKSGEIYKYVSDKVNRYPYMVPNAAKSEIARLRRAVGKKLQQVPETWGCLMEAIPEDLIGSGSKPDSAEEAIFIALTLFGLAQQGHDVEHDLQNEKDVSLGAAAGSFSKITKADSENDRMAPRLKRIISSTSLNEISVPLRAMIELISKEGIKLDFALLAKDLYQYSFPDSRESVKLKWARDYYRNLHKTGENSNQ